MNFVDPQVFFTFWLVPILALIFFLGEKTRKKRLALYSKLRLVELLTHTRSKRRAWLKAIMLCLATGLIVLSLARPRWGFQWQEKPTGGIDIMVVLDLSRSMLATDVKPNRLEHAKREILDLLSMLKGDRLGLVAFAGVAYVQCPLTVDYRLAQLFVQQLSTDLIPVQGTSIARALRLATKSLAEASKSDAQGKAIILITDGEDQEGEALEAAKEAMDKGVKIYSVGIGRSEGAPIALAKGGFLKDRSGQVVISKLDEKTLESLAEMTGGRYVRGQAGDYDLEQIYQQGIHKDLTVGEYGKKRQRMWFERFQWFLLLAFILLFLEAILGESRRKKLRGSKAQKAYQLMGMLFLIIFSAFSTRSLPANSLSEAKNAYQEKNYKKATEEFQKKEIEETENLKHAYNRAVSQFKDMQFDKAIEGFTKSAQSKDKELATQSLHNLGNSLVAKGKLEEALGVYKKVMELKKDDKKAKENSEWVKKYIEKKKQQQKKQNKNSDKKEDKKNKDQKEDKKSQQEQNEKNKEKQESQSSKQDEQKKKDKDKQDSRAKEEKEKKAQEKKQKSSAAKQENKKKDPKQEAQEKKRQQEEISKEEAARLLRSLEDKSWQYGKPYKVPGDTRQLEKDW